MRVLKSTRQDDKKLQRAMNCVHSAIDKAACAGTNEPVAVTNFKDASHTVHDDHEGHTSAASLLSIGLTSSQSSEKKLTM